MHCPWTMGSRTAASSCSLVVGSGGFPSRGIPDGPSATGSSRSGSTPRASSLTIHQALLEGSGFKAPVQMNTMRARYLMSLEASCSSSRRWPHPAAPGSCMFRHPFPKRLAKGENIMRGTMAVWVCYILDIKLKYGAAWGIKDIGTVMRSTTFTVQARNLYDFWYYN